MASYAFTLDSSATDVLTASLDLRRTCMQVKRDTRRVAACVCRVCQSRKESARPQTAHEHSGGTPRVIQAWVDTQ